VTSARPDVIVVLTDDQGYGDLACHGNPVAQAPHLDRLHDESVRLADFHAAPMCTPSRGQLLTGLDAARNGAVNVSSGRTLLRADLQTLADLFRAGGYRTGIFGKWRLGDNCPYRPQDRGFDESLWSPSSHISSHRFELRRWPRESALALDGACAAATVTDGALEEGTALPIARAGLVIGRREYAEDVGPGQDAAAFTVTLEAGPALLHTWFDDTRQQPICGAYYVYVSRLD